MGSGTEFRTCTCRGRIIISISLLTLIEGIFRSGRKTGKYIACLPVCTILTVFQSVNRCQCNACKGLTILSRGSGCILRGIGYRNRSRACIGRIIIGSDLIIDGKGTVRHIRDGRAFALVICTPCLSIAYRITNCRVSNINRYPVGIAIIYSIYIRGSYGHSCRCDLIIHRGCNISGFSATVDLYTA